MKNRKSTWYHRLRNWYNIERKYLSDLLNVILFVKTIFDIFHNH